MQSTVRALAALLFFAGAGVCLVGASACGPSTKWEFSAPETTSTRSGRGAGVGVLKVPIENLTVSIQPHNFHRIGQTFWLLGIPIPRQVDHEDVRSPFQVWLQVEASNAAPVRFDPGRVALIADGQSMRPTGFIGPGRTLQPAADSSSPAMLCVPTDFRTVVDPQWYRVPKRIHGPEAVQTPACFLLMFDTSPDPSRDFRLVMNGIQASDRDMPTLTVVFKKSEASTASSIF